MIRYLLFFCISFLFSSCYISKANKYKKYPLSKLNEFPAENFPKSTTPFRFIQGGLNTNLKNELDSMLIGSNHYALLIVRNDSIIYEKYNEGISDTTLLPSFSVAKSFVSTLVEIAYEEGKIQNLDEPITNYLPELLRRDKRFRNINIQHVLDMRSGIQSSENYYNPMSDVLRLGFGKNIARKALRISIEKEPNTGFEYKSINTQLLGMIIERATGTKLQDYYAEKIQKPLQFEHSASWIYDDEKHKTLRAFCCMNLTARDYAKFGRLILNKGNWNGQQIIRKEWVDILFNNDTLKNNFGYKNQWWKEVRYKLFSDSIVAKQFYNNHRNSILEFKKNDVKNTYLITYYNDGIYARGLLGQYIYVIPKKNTIIVILSNTLNPNQPIKQGLMEKISETFK